MELRTWRSFSANNSGSFYLVGDFRSADEAGHTAELLRHVLDGADRLVTGEAENEDVVIHELGAQLLVWCGYGLGFTEDVERILSGSGQVARRMAFREPEIAVLVPLDDHDAYEQLLGQLGESDRRRARFFDDHIAGATVQAAGATLENLRRWLREHGAGEPLLSVDQHHLSHRFAAMDDAQCTACDGAELRYLPAALFDTEVDQVACQACGGMFDAATFFRGEVLHLSYRDYEMDPVCLDPLLRDHLIIGRAGTADVRFARAAVARHHARVEVSDDHPSGFVIVDLGGTRSTQLNGERLIMSQPQPVADGDVIDIAGEFALEVSIGARG